MRRRKLTTKAYRAQRIIVVCVWVSMCGEVMCATETQRAQRLRNEAP